VTRESSAPPARFFAGTSGWAYPTWKPGFYPASTSSRNLLRFYSSQLNSVEVNYTFTKLPTVAMVESWLAQTPGDFRFSFKAPQRITHFSRLLDCTAHVEAFLVSVAPIAAAGKLGLILFQLPPNFKPDLPRLRAFLDLPALATAPPLAFEFRHPGWFEGEAREQTEALFAQRNVAFCNADYGDAPVDLQTPELHPAATHTCFRLRRPGGYSLAELQSFAKRFLALAASRDVYVYLRHEDEPTGALNAVALRQFASQTAESDAK